MPVPMIKMEENKASIKNFIRIFISILLLIEFYHKSGEEFQND
jgi:hypothetical protein